MSELQSIFTEFASFGCAPTAEMDNSHFSKMLKESKIIGKVFTSTDADILFNKIKRKGERKITCEEFETRAIPEIAVKLKKNADQVVEMITKASPQARATKTENVRLHDPSTYTGVRKVGTPDVIGGGPMGLSNLVERERKSDVRGQISTDR